MIMKAKARLFKGIEFVTIGDLPAEQRMLIETSPAEPERIKILIEGKIVENCVQYNKYVDWYTSIYTMAVPAQRPPVASGSGAVPAKTA
jgi:hypothetical protein